MKVLLGIPCFLILSGLGGFARFGIRPFQTPYEHARSAPSARDYWVEYEEGGEGRLRHKWGRSWPIAGTVASGLDHYRGESCRLWVLEPPGLGERFLVLYSAFGAYTCRYVLWHLRSSTDLVQVAYYSSVGEIHGDRDSDALEAVFQDVDGDGREEVSEAHRLWLFDENGELLDNWGLRSVHSSWDGTRFMARSARLTALGQTGPLVGPEDPASEDPFRAGLDIGDAR